MNPDTLKQLQDTVQQINDSMVELSKMMQPIMQNVGQALTKMGYPIDDFHDEQDPLFTARLDSRGRLTIPDHVRKREGFLPGCDVEIFDIKLSNIQE